MGSPYTCDSTSPNPTSNASTSIINYFVGSANFKTDVCQTLVSSSGVNNICLGFPFKRLVSAAATVLNKWMNRR